MYISISLLTNRVSKNMAGWPPPLQIIIIRNQWGSLTEYDLLCKSNVLGNRKLFHPIWWTEIITRATSLSDNWDYHFPQISGCMWGKPMGMWEGCKEAGEQVKLLVLHLLRGRGVSKTRQGVKAVDSNSFIGCVSSSTCRDPGCMIMCNPFSSA